MMAVVNLKTAVLFTGVQRPTRSINY